MSLLLDALKLSDANVKTAINTSHKNYEFETDLNLDLLPLDTDVAQSSQPQSDLLNRSSESSSIINSASEINPNIDNHSDNADSSSDLNSLISRVNSQNHRQKIIKRLAISFILLFVFTAGAAYLFIESEMSRQTLYISPAATLNSSQHQLEMTPENINLTSIKTNIAVSQTHMPIKPEILSAEVSLAVSTDKTDTIDRPVKTIVNKLKTVAVARQAAPPKALTVTRINPNIHIVHKTIPNPVHLLLSRAYDLFKAADYPQSQKFYQQVLSADPKNRNALLGIAAVAIKNQHFDLAQQKYILLLQLNPKDSLAISGLNSIQNNRYSQSTESQLKFMLKHQPDAAHLYFSLGSLYAYRQKWHQAQSAFFNAWSFDNSNADYCYNLAVSLDHLNKPQQALNFYQLSLSLTQTIAANFSSSDIQQRIMILQERLK